jgi:UDP:flavonoid glycosyltransferase YjiC (YdhE family)
MLVVAIGSMGDLHPMAALALALRDRGHRVRFVTYPKFEPLVHQLRLESVKLGSSGDDIDATKDPDLRRRGKRAITRHVRPIYEVLAQEYRPGETVVIAPGNAFGARIAQEKLGAPLVSVLLQPAILRSQHDAPGLPLPELPGSLTPLSRILRRLQFAAADRLVTDPIVVPPLNRFREELGLPSVRRPFAGWIHSPDLVIGLFPDWFAARQPDWPSNTYLTGFPLFDESSLREVPSQLESFLTSGPPPIVFTWGTGMRFGRNFFEVATQVCRAMDQRGVLLTQYSDQVPASLPDGVCHFEYVPLSKVLPRSLALVHHGGIGTLAQALAAGIPQLVVPWGHDQPDNAVRLTRLGVGLVVSRRGYRRRTVVRALSHLLQSRQVAGNCRSLASKIAQTQPLSEACRLIELVAARIAAPPPKTAAGEPSR